MSSSSSSSDDLKPAVVIDNGSSTIRAGLAGCSQPAVVFPTEVAISKTCLMVGMEQKHKYIGNEVEANRNKLCPVRYPIQYGCVVDWDDMESIWSHTFDNELHVDPTEHPVLLTEGSNVPKANREKPTQIMFETFRVPAMFLEVQSALTLYASGRSAGMVLESGDETTICVPVYEGHVLRHATCRHVFGGRTLTNFMGRMLNERYKDRFDVECAREYRKVFKDVKEKLCYVAYDFKHELDNVLSSTVDRTYEVSDKQLINIGTERFRCAETYFDPLLLEFEMPGIHTMLVRSIKLCDPSIQAEMYAHIQLSGGSTMFPGFAERLRKEVEKLAPAGMEVTVHPPPHGVMSAWVGGSLKAAKPAFLEAALTYDTYEEYGPSIIHRLCHR